MDQNYGEFIVKILEVLKKNGFPSNQVSLPLEKMYEVAHTKGLNFNKVLDFLDEKEGIEHTKTDEKIIFSPKVEKNSFDPSGLDLSELEKMMAHGDGQLDKDLLEKAKSVLGSMSPAQLQSMMTMFQNLPADKKAEIMKKAEDLSKS